MIFQFFSTIEEGWREKQRQRSSRLFEGQNLFNSLPRYLFCLGRFGGKGWINPFLTVFFYFVYMEWYILKGRSNNFFELQFFSINRNLPSDQSDNIFSSFGLRFCWVIGTFRNFRGVCYHSLKIFLGSHSWPHF